MDWVGINWIWAAVLAYLIGSIPAAYLAGRLIKGTDIREEGDRNPGAENAYRIIGPKIGLAVGAADVAKGAVAVLVARVLTEGNGAEMMAGVVVIAGHNWPIFLRLRGGRGAASTVGVFMALIWMPAVPLSLASLALLPKVKSATVAMGLIMIPMPFLVWLTTHSPSLVAYSVALPVFVGLRHYWTSRKSHRLQEDQSEGRALPQG